MTESEWMACEDPATMLNRLMRWVTVPFVRMGIPSPSNRKLRLFATACARSLRGQTTDKARTALEAAEAFADGMASLQWMKARRNSLRTAHGWNVLARWACLADAAEAARQSVSGAYRASGEPREVAGRMARLAGILRDTVGNPWRPVALPAACPWLTPLARSLAEAAYAERRDDGSLDPARLAVLSDALEEAGCPSDETCPACGGKGEVHDGSPYGSGLGQPGPRSPFSDWERCPACDGERRGPDRFLANLRCGRPLYRGCWSLDLILGKG